MHCRNKTVTPKIECDKNLNKLKVSNKVLHCVYDSPNKTFRTGTPWDLCHSVVNKRPIQPNYVSIASVNGPKHSVPDIFAINLDNTTCGYDINPNLNEFHKESIIRLIKENYVDTHKIEEFPHDYEMKLRLTSDMPISFPPRRLSYSDKLEVDKMVAELLDQGFIRPSNSPYAFPIVVVPKKTGERRMCVDYRPLNKVTLRDNYPLPLIDDCLERMENKNYFSLLDLKSGFHQIRMSVDSIPLTSFVTPSGQYEYLRMPFGLRNAPAVFQRFINWVLRPFINEGSGIVYIDDIAIASKTIPEHFDLLGKVLRRLAEFRLEIKLSKCLFCYSEIDLLDFTISSNGIRPNNRHIESIQRLSVPANTHDMQKCLGLFSYFRRFIPSFSTISAPLRQLLKSGVKYDFDSTCADAFELLRTKLISAPVLTIYSPTRETELHCDASSLGFGGILMQKQEDGKFHPVAYFSKRASPAESRYHSFELETLAIIYSLRKFRIYLEGIPFRIITDCNSLTLTLSRKSVNARIARWSLELENYHYELE